MRKSKYQITIEIESDTDPRDWCLGETLVIDEPYEVIQITGGKQQ